VISARAWLILYVESAGSSEPTPTTERRATDEIEETGSASVPGVNR
jgi:hypothetical protein